MASLIHKGDRWTLQFRLRPDQDRLTIALGSMSEADAECLRKRVGILVNAHRAGEHGEIDVPTATWVSKLPDDLHAKLARAGLVMARRQQQEQAAATAPTVASFVGDYIRRRGDVKPATAIFYGHTRRCLVEFFGATRPLDRITASEAEDFRRWLATSGGEVRGTKGNKKQVPLSDNTVRRRCGMAKQFFRDAMRRKLIAENPFGDMKGCVVKGNAAKEYFIKPEVAAAVLDKCPDVQWQLIFALSRYGGLRCPSEHLALTWDDVDLPGGKMVVHSPKTEHHEGKACRVVPIFPELRPYLEAVWDEAPEGSRHVITRYRMRNTNLRTQLQKIIKRAGFKPWPKLFQNLRATRATELIAAGWPEYKVCSFLGHSAAVAKKHYWQVTDEDFKLAATTVTTVTTGGSPNNSCSALQPALQIGVQQPDATGCKTVKHNKKSPGKRGVCRVSEAYSVGDGGLEPSTSAL